MLNQPALGQSGEIRSAAHASPAGAEAMRMFHRTLAAWVLDCARLRRLGLDRPRHRYMAPGPGSVLGPPASRAQLRGA